MLRCADNSLYCGQTKDLAKRLKQHNSSKSAGAKYTKSHRPVVLIYSEEYETLTLAMQREAAVKKWSKKRKEALVNNIQKI